MRGEQVERGERITENIIIGEHLFITTSNTEQFRLLQIPLLKFSVLQYVAVILIFYKKANSFAMLQKLLFLPAFIRNLICGCDLNLERIAVLYRYCFKMQTCIIPFYE